ncbi:ATP-binding protein [Thermophagus sp. OGC60D27]|uniref:ATP-binding protein n=1 Tax=Thermophagus sp. OGC60D27 TaxID=3458415 RepID=UPI0040381593
MYGFRRKLTVLMVALVSIAMILAGLPGIYLARKQARADAIRLMELQMQITTQNIENQFIHLKEVSLALEAAFRSSFNPEQHFVDDKSLDQFESEFLPHVKEILHLMRPMSLWFVFDGEKIDGDHTISFFDRKQNGVYTRSTEYNIAQKDLFHPSMHWWTQAIDQGETWTSPYYWPDWDMNVISYSKAIFADSLFIGCLGSDFNFDRLSAYLDTIQLFKTGQILLFDNHHNLVYPQTNQTPFKPISQTWLDSIGKNRKDVILINEENGIQSSVLAFDCLKNGWMVVLVVSQDEIFEDVFILIRALFFVLIGGFLVALFLALYFSKYITMPINTLLNSFRKATDGDLSIRADISSSDEMQELGDHFNLMMNSLERSFNQLEIAQKKITIEKERAQESDHLKSSFLENLSHEIRTPLMAIVGFSELMADSQSTSAERREFFDHIASNSSKLVRFIEDTLLFAQLEKGQTPVKKELFMAREILRELQEEYDLKRAKEKPDLFFRVLSDGCEIQLNTDPKLLKRLMGYLLDNAFKYTDSGGVTLVCRKTPYHYELSVSDSGIGIPDDQTDMVFKKFCKVAESKEKVYDGAGIGLTNAREIVLLLGGTIELSSTYGEGTTVTVSLPLH